MFISIIIPVLNEEDSIKPLLQQLQKIRQQGHEVIVVDGGSTDKTVSLSELLADKVITSSAGRAIQMNKGASHSKNEILWFLHADTLIPEGAIKHIQHALKNRLWGRFNIHLSGKNILFRIIGTMMNLRSCLSGIVTGDQGIFIDKLLFNQTGGFPNIPLMEDIAISKNLKKFSRPACVKEKLITSSRRWEKNGILSTVFLMWKLRFLFWLGVSANKIALQYK